MEISLIVALAVIWVAVAGFCAWIFAANERNGLATFLLVLFCGPLASIILILGEARAARRTERRCQDGDEPISTQDSVCPYCRSEQNVQLRPDTSPVKESEGGLSNKAAWAVIASTLAAAALVAVFYTYLVSGK